MVHAVAYGLHLDLLEGLVNQISLIILFLSSFVSKLHSLVVVLYSREDDFDWISFRIVALVKDQLDVKIVAEILNLVSVMNLEVVKEYSDLAMFVTSSKLSDVKHEVFTIHCILLDDYIFKPILV